MNLICWLFGHRCEAGLRLKMCLLYHCTRCHRLIPGGLHPRKRNR